MSHKHTNQSIIEKFKDVHGDKFDYSNVVYIDTKHKVEIICPLHGSFFQLPTDHYRGRGCIKCKYENHSSKLKDNINTFISKAVSIHGSKYDYSKVDYVDSYHNVEIICPIHNSFNQSPNNHINNNAGCPSCANMSKGLNSRKTTINYISDCKLKYGDEYDYSVTDYKTAHSNVTISCKKHGIFSIRARDHLHNGRGCPSCSASISNPEKYITKFLTDNNINFKTKDRTIIKPLELDFYLPDYNLAIEFDGLYYHSEITGNKSKTYHLNKTTLCEQLGIQLIHIFEDEYLNNPEILISRLKHILRLTRYKIFARKCHVKVIDYKTKRNFLEKYHIQGDTQSKVNLGLFYKNRLVQVMTFAKKRISLGLTPKTDEWELSRMASIKNFNIVGGASKILCFFERTFNPKIMITYADRRWSKGNVYFNLGFTNTHTSKPNYWYFLINNNSKKWHRYVFAKHTLDKKLKIYDPSISEWENMKLNNYDRIWDCGNLVFEKYTKYIYEYY